MDIKLDCAMNTKRFSLLYVNFLRFWKPLQEPSTINLTLRWIRVDRDQSKIIIKYKTILQGLFRQRVYGRIYDISAGQHQPSLGLLTENANLHGIYILDINRKLHEKTTWCVKIHENNKATKEEILMV